jgi:hypothetical protein
MPVTLDGTKADGDADFANSAAHIVGGMPGLPGVSGELYVVGTFTYFRGYQATKFTEGAATDLPVNPAQASQGLYLVKQIVAAASDKTLRPVLVGTEQEPGGAAYHIRVAVTAEALSSQLANLLAVKNKASGQLDVWITQGDFQLERLEFTTSDPAAGAAAIRLVLSNWNNVAAIKAPPQAQIVAPAQ